MFVLFIVHPYDIFIFSAALIGLAYPYMDEKLGKAHRFKREWSCVMRCIAVFVGINHASAVSNLGLFIKTIDCAFCRHARVHPGDA